MSENENKNLIEESPIEDMSTVPKEEGTSKAEPKEEGTSKVVEPKTTTKAVKKEENTSNEPVEEEVTDADLRKYVEKTANHNPKIKKVGAKKRSAFFKSKKFFIGLGVVGVLIILMIIKSLLGANKGTESNYFSVLDKILNSDGGQFTYTITVNSGKHTKGGLENKVADVESTQEAVPTTEGTESSATESTPTTTPDADEESILDSTKEGESEKTLTAKTSDWGTQDGTALTEWEYPNYTIKLSGECTSVDPYEAHLNVLLATENFSNNFTDIIATKDAYYINVEQMKYWLENSKDSYLVSLAKDMPDGSKYVSISTSDFAIPSRYAEDGEKAQSSVKSLYDYKKHILNLIGLVEGSIENYCTFDSNSKDGYLMSATGEDGANIASALKQMITNSGDCFDGYVNTLNLDKDALTQKEREKDNVMMAMQKAMTYMNLTTVDAMNFQMSGNALTLKNGDNNQQYEANLNLQYTLNDTDYAVQISAIRVGAQGEAVKAPTESVSDSLMTLDDILGITDNVTDYFNFTDIELGKKLEPTPDNSINTVLQNFVDLVNENNCYDDKLSVHNVMSFLQKYSNIKEQNATDDNEKACIILTNDFLTKFGNMITEARKKVVVDEITGEQTDSNNETVDENAGVEQYPEAKSTLDGVDVTFKVDAKKSNAKLLVVDMKAVNNSDKDVTLDETNFQVKSLLGSIYPSNNKTLLGGYDSDWYTKYEKDISTELKVKAGSEAKGVLYFVISDDNGYMDIWYDDNNLGVVVQY